MYPLVMAISHAESAPFISSAAYLSANILTQFPLGWILGKAAATDLDTANIEAGGTLGWRKHWPMLTIPFTVLFFALAVRWLESAVAAAIIAESWPLLFAPAVVSLTQQQDWEWETATLRNWSGMLLGCCGMALVLSSQGLNAAGGTVSATLGASAALAAAACTACMSFGHRWAEDISEGRQAKTPKGRASQHAQAMCYRPACLFWSAPLLLAAGLIAGETGKLEAGNVAVLLCGGAIVACARPLIAVSVAMENNLGGFSVMFAQPVVSLLWLVAAGETGNVNWMLIGLGGALMTCGLWSSMR